MFIVLRWNVKSGTWECANTTVWHTKEGAIGAWREFNRDFKGETFKVVKVS